MLLIILFCTSSVAQMTQGRWENQVRIQLREYTETLSAGYDLVESHDPIVYSLNRNTYIDVSYDLQRGEAYMFVGVCDTDCREINFELYDYRGTLIDSSLERNNVTPAVGVVAYRDTTVRLRLTMANCRHNPCWVGIGAYTR